MRSRLEVETISVTTLREGATRKVLLIAAVRGLEFENAAPPRVAVRWRSLEFEVAAATTSREGATRKVACNPSRFTAAASSGEQ